jgi:primosomal protein N' (replication factor Y)
VEEQLRGLFPGIGIGVLDRDHVRGSGGVGAILERFLRKELQVLVGTQMLSKGHHFPDVELAAVLDADSYWSLPDFRAAERAYALFVQMGGRAGRAARPGRFFLQTFRPDHYVVQAVVRGDREGFLERELRFRELFGYPPTSYLARVLSENPNKNRAAALVGEVAEKLQPFAAERGIRLQGPAPAPMERLRGRWRFQLLVLSSSRRELRAALESVLAGRDRKSLQVDVDPLQLL